MLTLRQHACGQALTPDIKVKVMSRQSTQQLFSRVGLIVGKQGDPYATTTLKELIQYLHTRGREILLDEASAALAGGLPASFGVVDRATLGARADVVFVVGGDGTLLSAARSLVDCEVPILGINLGRLGFLADISPTEMADKLDQILAGEYEVERRAMLHARVLRGEREIGESNAFNDVVIHSSRVARMIEYETTIDGKFVNRVNADGIIIATPTGSTAYALSSGGPIVHPALNALVLVTVCPHTMSHRPIVIDGDSQVEIVLGDRNQAAAGVSCDGQVDITLENGDRVLIRRKTHPIHLIHPKGHKYYSILRAKLHWGKRLKPD
jgi:NAD+ kinase